MYATLPHDLFVGQFLLCRDKTIDSDRWAVFAHGPWRLSAHRSLPVIQIFASDHIPIGWLLGRPINGDRLITGPSLLLDFDPASDDFVKRFEQFTYDLGGHFVAVCIAPPLARVYLDACGMRPVVFSNSQASAASSSGLLGFDESDIDHDLGTTLGLPRKDNWYGFGLTPYPSVARLIPNHFLDLNTWQTDRHWPAPTDIEGTRDFEEAVAEIRTIVERQFRAIAAFEPLWNQALTAGHDTRSLLAIAKAYRKQIVFHTVATRRFPMDYRVARNIARDFGLVHRVAKFQQPTKADIADWLARTGYCVAGGVLRNCRTSNWLGDRPTIGGIGGEIAQLKYRKKSDHGRGALSPIDLLGRLKMPLHPRLVSGAEQWLEDVASVDPAHTLDLLYIEQKLACRKGPAFVGATRSFVTHPLCHRRIIERALGIDPERRRGNNVPIEIIRQSWPELLTIPFNEPPGFRGVARKGQQRLRRFRGRLWRFGQRLRGGTDHNGPAA